MTCTCGNPADFATCCGPVIAGTAQAGSPEQLMRARYSAYVKGEIDFLEQSLAASERAHFDRGGAENWAKMAKWEGLDIVRTEGGGASDAEGTVEFVAHYSVQDKRVDHHEIATFRRDDGRWFFVDGVTPKPQPFRRATPKVGLNDPCSCGSGKKFKKCCGKV